jgi:hypothetical protein
MLTFFHERNPISETIPAKIINETASSEKLLLMSSIFLLITVSIDYKNDIGITTIMEIRVARLSYENVTQGQLSTIVEVDSPQKKTLRYHTQVEKRPPKLSTKQDSAI